MIGLTAAACLSTPPPAQDDGPAACTDGDGDGWSTCGTYVDCADGDPAIHPGAFEEVGGADRDCAPGVPDRAAPTLTHAVVGSDHVVTRGAVAARLVAASGGQLGSLVFDNAELLYTGAIPERLAGALAWDLGAPSNSARAIGAMGTITPTLIGRGLARFRVSWDAGALAGVSTFTVTADARIVRTDDLTFMSEPRFASLTSYVALRPALLTTLHREELAGGATTRGVDFEGADLSEIALAGQPGDDGALCAAGPGREVGWTVVAATTLSEDAQPIRGLRASRSRDVVGGATSQVALQFDWEWFKVAQLGSGRRVAHAAMWVGAPGATPCAEALGRMRELRRPRPLIDRAGAAPPAPVDYDVGGDGFIDDGGYWALEPTGGPIRFRFDVGAGAAPRWTLIHVPAAPGSRAWGHDIVAIREAAGGERARLIHGQDYLVDLDPAGGLWLSLLGDPGADVIELVGPVASCPSCDA